MDITNNKTLGEFVIILGEMHKLGQCSKGKFSRAINLAKQHPKAFKDLPSVRAAAEMAVEVV